ncbi:DUF3466 family protein [Alteromonas halophila]|uniref:DUF3466 family protein n=1 Tax=Alteromonas halophila TaxID=516698 RepID=A0A918JLR7_9ALTE|nr:DUF3466 family protein [Alteromonas halophila]GGW88549.1 hypothetical protein GCM10007391_23260 [Alteromonas halophila]
MKRTQLAAAIILASGFCTEALGATYSVTPLPLRDIAQNNFARSIDNSGRMLSTVQSEFNPPFDLEQLKDDTSFFSGSYPLENEDDAREGIFSDADYQTLYEFLLDTRGRPLGQQLAIYRTYSADTVDARLVPGLDEVTDKFDDYTQSVNSIARDSLYGDYIVGSSDGITIEDPYEDEDGNIVNYTYNTMTTQAFVEVNGQSKRLPPDNELLGGIGQAYAVNDNLQVAGYSTVSFQQSVRDLIDDCEDPDERADLPEAYCKSQIYNNRNRFLFDSIINATIWQLDASGDVISTETFPLIFTPEDDDDLHYFSYAYAINNNGIAVGESLTGESVIVTRPESGQLREDGRVATVYRDGQTIELLPREENLQSAAFGINDNNWVTGYVLRAISSTARQQLFVYNLDTNEARYPEGFFAGSGVDANAINNNNIVVGKADVESSNEAVREAHAFMYNIDNETFTDLNDLIACDSPYSLVEAVDINDSNEIIANARFEGVSRYITGNPILDSDGTEITEDIIIAVKLTPEPNGEIEQCDADGDGDVDEDDPNYERQGAAISAWWLLLLGLVGFRRRH